MQGTPPPLVYTDTGRETLVCTRTPGTAASLPPSSLPSITITIPPSPRSAPLSYHHVVAPPPTWITGPPPSS